MRTASRVTKRIPPLQPGDRLDVVEFERRYDAMPDLKKAELIDGVVYMPSPVRFDAHAEPHGDLMTWLGVYRANTPGVSAGANATLRLLKGKNRPQPDSCLRISAASGGQSSTDEDDYVRGAPELVAEVAASTASYDLNAKLNAYQLNSVQEYVVWRVEDEVVDWFRLRGDEYRPLSSRQNVVKSKVFPGLWLDMRALLKGDLARVLDVLQKGIASDEHRRFVAKLKRRKK